jgi:hypothetical protein
MQLEIEASRTAVPMPITEIIHTAYEKQESLEDLGDVDVIEDAPPTYSIECQAPRSKKGKRRRRPPIAHSDNIPWCMSLANLGLGFHYARLIVELVSIVVGLFGSMAVGLAMGTPAMALGLAIVFGFLTVVMSAVMAILGLTGSILCAWVPARSGARPLIIVSAALDAPLLPAALVPLFVAMGYVGFQVYGFVSSLLGLASWILFMLFLRALSFFLSEDTMGREAERLLIRGLVLLLLVPITVSVLLFLIVLAVPILIFFVVPVAFLASIYWIVLAIKFIFEVLNLIGSIRQVIRSRG